METVDGWLVTGGNEKSQERVLAGRDSLRAADTLTVLNEVTDDAEDRWAIKRTRRLRAARPSTKSDPDDIRKAGLCLRGVNISSGCERWQTKRGRRSRSRSVGEATERETRTGRPS